MKLELQNWSEIIIQLIPVVLSIIMPFFISLIKKNYWNYKRKVKVYKYINWEITMFLFYYELFGVLIVQIFAVIIAGFQKQWSAVDIYIFRNILIGVFPFYIVVPIYFIKSKRNSIKCSVCRNLLIMGVIYFFYGYISYYFYKNGKSLITNLTVIFLLYIILILQLFTNLQKEKIREIEYIVYLKKRKLIRSTEFPYQDKQYTYIKRYDKEKLCKVIEVRNKDVVKIEQIISDIGPAAE